MANNRQGAAPSSRAPRPNNPVNIEDMDFNITLGDPTSRNKQVRWTDAMDGFMISALVQQVQCSHKRSDNGFTLFQISKAIESVYNGCRVVVTEKNVRSRLKTIKQQYAEVRQLLSMSGFGLDPGSGRIIADPLAWEEFITGKPEFAKWKTKLCSRYEELEAIFGNDTATGERAVTGFEDFSPMQGTEESMNDMEELLNDDIDPSPTCSRKRKSEDGTSKTKRRRTKPIDDSVIALSTLAESSKKIASAMEMQATLDTLNHINWQMILDKLRGMNLEKRDVMQVIIAFKLDESSARVFMNLTDGEFMHDLVFETLGRDPPPHAP